MFSITKPPTHPRLPAPHPGHKKFNSRPVVPTFPEEALRRQRRRAFLFQGRELRHRDV